MTVTNIKSGRTFILDGGAAREVGRGVRRLVHQVHKNSVLILNICLLLFHFPLQNQISQISLLRKPNEKFLEGSLDRPLPLLPRNEQTRHVARPCDPLYFS